MKTYKRLSILCIAVLLCALLPVLAGATSPGDPSKAVDPNAVYVSDSGNDTTGNGSQNSPYATLAKAVEMAAQQESATIYVMSNLTMSDCARFWTGDITITSAPGAETPYTISRGKDMESVNDSVDPVQDMARGGYNPALIEVGNSASLTLENIVLDDGHIMAYTYSGGDAYASAETPVFVQVDASRGGNVGDGNPDNNPGSTTVGETNVSNFEIVQDAIIATYSGDATITLGDGAVLQNYGGMSAVRVSGGTLVMKSGSKICDSDTSYTRIKGATDSYGPAGAVWVQSGIVEMQKGSLIENINGRVVYSDGAGSDVSIAGTIQNITGNSQMWQGNNGSVAHIRNGSSCTLADGCLITNDFSETSKVTGNMFSIIQENSQLLMENGAKIQNWTGAGNVFYVAGAQNQYKCTLKIDGEISGVNTGGNHIVQATQAIVSIKENAYIHHNKVTYGSIYIQGGNEVDIYGKINYNYSTDRGGAIAITNHGDSTVNMYDGAELVGNYSKETGGGLLVSDGTFTMYGGIISENVASLEGGGVFVREGGSFVMAGGTITDNITATVGGGIAFQAGGGCVILETGTITDNVMKATVTSNDTEGTFAAQGGDSNDISITSTGSSNMSTYCTVDSHFVLGNPDVYMQKYDFTLLDPQRGTKLGNASTNGETALQKASTAKGWSDSLLASFWAKTDNNQTWVLSGLTKTSDNLPVYALVMPTDIEGNVVADTEATVYAVTVNADGTWRFAVPAGETNGYVVGLVQPTEDYGTLALTVSPTQVTEGEDSHTFQYQAVYTISGSLKNMLDQEPNVGDFTLTFVLDSNLTCTDANDANYDSDTHTLTVTVSADKLDGYTFHFSAETADGITLTAGDQLVTSAVLSGQVGMTQVTVPSAPAVVEVVAQTPVTPPVTPSEPADPDDTGVSDLLDTENHNQYLFGYPEGTFGPDQNMTRAEVAQMFYNLLVDKNVAITASFEDVPADAWYAKSVNTLASMGIISGVGENRFEPERSITRAEFTSMAMKFTKGALDGTNVFSDVHSGDWFYEAVVGSIQYGWIEGYEDGTFRPENRITRVEVTSIVNKMLGRFADREFVAGHADELNAFSDVTSTHWGYYHIVEATNSHTYTKPSTNVETWTELK